MVHNSTLKDFEKALSRLDELLKERNYPSIEIKALGGFAMMYYGVREQGYTVDIDSLTSEYDDNVLELIVEVGNELDLEDDWLNTDCAMLEGAMSKLASQIKWVNSQYHYERINLLIADEIGLLRSKAKAVHDGGLVPRITDKKDLVDLLKIMNVENVGELDKRPDLSFISREYERSYDFLKTLNGW